MYALSANYGGLIARMIFRPIEDACRNLFSQLCAPAEPTSKGPAKSTNESGQARESVEQAASTFKLIMHAYSIVSLIIIAVGPTAAPLLLGVVAGSRWSKSGAGEVLGTYCYSIPLLAINGVSEAFVAAAANTKQLNIQSIWMGFFSAAFAGSAYVFLRILNLEAKGLVLANCVNMLLRCVFNLNFVSKFFATEGLEFSWTDALPNMYAVASTVAVPSVLSATTGALDRYGTIGELARVAGIGGSLALFV